MSWQGMSFDRHLKGIVRFPMILKIRTGLLIRMPRHAQIYRIGGADLYPMVTRVSYGDRDIEVPYIPGSSLKGRMRALLELATGQKLLTTDGKIWQYMRNLSAMRFDAFMDDIFSRNLISELFGWSAANYKQLLEELKEERRRKSGGSPRYNEDDINRAFKDYVAITRLLFSDFFPSKDYVKKINARGVSDFLEEKPENRLDRITAAADPREVVRVRPGVEFEGEIAMLLFNIDYNENHDMIGKYLDTLITGLELIEMSYLGSSGSRGYGRVRFEKIGVDIFKIKVDQQNKGPELVEVKDEEVKEISEFSGDENESAVKKMKRERDKLEMIIKKKVFEGERKV